MKILDKIGENYIKKNRSILELSNQQLILPRYSKLLQNNRFFFGISKIQLDRFKFQRLSILFICESEEKVFVLPAEELLSHLNYNPAQDGSWKLSIEQQSDDFYLLMPSRNNSICISHYLNNYTLLNLGIRQKAFTIPEEVTESEKYYEGTTTKIIINTYERNYQARQKCLEKHGFDCCICDFNFEKNYGAIGRGFMHVHHLIPLSEIKEEYELDPIKDLRPVCPNCHAMIHMRKPPYTPEEILSLF
ncbi:HNH endonuclease [Calothrix sp. CCY 0018]|uniref:HNH endonuclease n=1 Tax=Calothrix sp. CCY 0018 TaxID=3103864 RepID=UPI0039C60E31